MDKPELCEDCESKRPTYVVRYIGPAEWVYYCDDCITKYKQFNKARSVNTVT